MKNPTLAVALGSLLKEYREALEISQEELADRVGAHRTYIGTLERGEKAVSVEVLWAYLAELKVEPAEFFTRLKATAKKGRRHT
jgi:transcriptional regulator with XRE-family HTH domain